MPASPSTSSAPPRLLAPLLWCVAAARAVATPPAALTPGPADLVPAEHHATPGVFIVLHRRSAADDAWARVADTLGPRLPDHVPLAPPPTEARAWQAAHLLYWVDEAGQAALARRFEPDALRAAIAGVRARLASPLFGVGDDEDVRRDPLGLTVLSGERALANATACGDLLSADGSALLIHLQTILAPAAVSEAVSAQLSAQFSSDSPEVVDIEVRAFRIGDQSSEAPHWVRGIFANLALLTLILTLGLRRLRFSLAGIAVIGAGIPLVWFLVGPLALVLIGAAAALASLAGRPRMPWLHLAVALLPLALLPYPMWRQQALVWPLAVLVIAVGVGFVLPIVQGHLRARPPEPPASARPLPPAAALAVCTVLLAAGLAAIRVAPPARIVADTPDLLAGLIDPSRTAEIHSRGDTPAAALAAAARDARTVSLAVPGAQLDGPARFVLDEDTLAARLATLTAIDLPGRIEFLRGALAEQGLRPDAFGEFFGALDPLRQPSPEAALHGPLGSWMQAALRQDDAGVVATTRVHLPTSLPDRLPAQLRGPAVFAHHDRRDFPGNLVLALAAGAWVSAFLTWLATGRLTPALTAAVVVVTTQVATLAAVATIVGEISPLLLPALLVVGAFTAATTAACTSDVGGPRGAVASACLAAPGLVLLTGDDPTWYATGLALALGAALGGLLAARVGPGLVDLMRRREVLP